MADWRTRVKSDYYKAEDVENGPILLTIKELNEEEQPWSKGEYHDVMSFRERGSKKLIMKPALYQNVEDITGNKDTDAWTGATVVLFKDPSVMMMGKRVGGVRLRAPRNRPQQQAPPPPPVQQPAYEEYLEPGAGDATYPSDDDIPF